MTIEREKIHPVDLNKMDTRTQILYLHVVNPDVFSRYVREGKHIMFTCLIHFSVIEQALFFVAFCCWFGVFYLSFSIYVVVKGLGFKMFVTPLQRELPTGCRACKTRTRAFK